MSDLKDLMGSFNSSDIEEDDNAIEVYADSVKQGLELASQDLQVDISMLDYEIVQKGGKGFLGLTRTPYILLVRPIAAAEDIGGLQEIDKKLSKAALAETELVAVEQNPDGKFKIRVTKSGIWLTVTAPHEKGKAIVLSVVTSKLESMRITNANLKLVEKEVKKPSGKPVKLGNWVHNPEYDGSMHVEISDDEMQARVHFTPPRFSGRHMEVDDVLKALKHMGVIAGIQEEDIAAYLDEMNYSVSLIAAKGQKPKNGRDAYIDYKVRIETEFNYSEVEGQVDFKDLNLIENVVVGQVLAVKVPAEAGLPGRTVTNRILPAKSGKDVQIKYGKGTILSEDGMELTAEKNGQVVMKAEKICVEELLVIQGDVDNTSGNVVMLGSVLVTGSVLDNFTVKASGNIEIRGSVQKAFIESEGDIIIRQGINGRDEAVIETTGGSVFAKFIQRAKVVAEKSVVVSEEILHSNVDAGKLIYCNGRRAQIVGGLIRAGDEVNAKQIGGDAYTKTEVHVGMNPKVLQQIADLKNLIDSITEEKEKVEKDVHTLGSKKRSAGALPAEQEKLLQNLTTKQEKLNNRYNEATLELEELNAYLGMLEQHGKVAAQRTLYPGVEIYIKDERLRVNDPYSDVSITLEGADWRFSNYELPDEEEGLTLKYDRRRK